MHWRAIAAEFLATLLLLLLAVVVGSGIMGETLAGGNVAIALLANSVATGTALVALILAFGPTSGAHMNPAVTLAAAATAFAVGAIVTAGYWFTASTSFANPAVTIARAATATFAGIRPADVLPFVLAQLLGALGAVAVFRSVLSPRRGER